jgi:hypothetical protein
MNSGLATTPKTPNAGLFRAWSMHSSTEKLASARKNRSGREKNEVQSS